jgi:hypothetical protein
MRRTPASTRRPRSAPAPVNTTPAPVPLNLTPAPGPSSAPGIELPAHPTAAPLQHSALLQLQRGQGNAHVQRMLRRRRAKSTAIQRDPPVAEPDAPTAEEEKQDQQQRAAVVERVYSAYWSLLKRLTVAQGGSHISPRADWIRELTMLPKGRDFAELGLLELYEANRKIEQIRAQVDQHSKQAHAQWDALNARYAEERERLDAEPSHANELALIALDELFDQITRDVERADDALTVDDITPFAHTLDTKRHIQIGEARAAHEEEDLDRERERLEELASEDDGPGVLSTVWSIVGWESWTDFAADVALTVATGGLGKVIGVGAKTARAANRMRKIKRTRRGMKAAMRSKKLASLAGRLARLASKARDVATTAAVEQRDFLVNNWPRLRRKIETDLLAELTTGDQKGLSSTALQRVEKEIVASWVEGTYPTREDEERAVGLAAVAAVSGSWDIATRQLGLFFKMNLRRRGLTNVIHQMLRATGRLEPSVGGILKEAAISTAFESAQDLVSGLPGLDDDTGKTLVEAIRKIIQQHWT